MHPVNLVVVEDMPTEAEIAIRQLESGGFACTWKRVDSESALRRSLDEAKPDLILSDFTLPGFDGLSALEIAREVTPDVPFMDVVLSIAIDAAAVYLCLRGTAKIFRAATLMYGKRPTLPELIRWMRA